MYIEGIVYALDEQNIKVKLQLPSYDDFITEWLSVPQLFCIGNKARKSLPKEGSLVAAILDEDMSNGCVLGSLYNDEDKIPNDMQDSDFIEFEDGTSIRHNNDLTGFDVVKDLRVLGDVIVDGNIVSSKDIQAYGDVSDKKSPMQDMRDIYNSHNHPNGNNGSPTGSPGSNM